MTRQLQLNCRYGRLNLTGTVLSKRKILRLVNEGVVRAWDDPRLFTLVAIKRRGVPPGAILAFVNELGVTTATTNIQIHRFEQSVRRYLEDHTPRLSMILEPVLVVIENLPDSHLEECVVPFKPNDPTMGEHRVPFTNRVYIEAEDFRVEDAKGYKRLAPNKIVGLQKVPFPIRALSYEKDATTGNVNLIRARYEIGSTEKPKAWIHWVAEAPSYGSPVKIAEARLFTLLFNSELPDTHPQGFLAAINPDSEKIHRNSVIEIGLKEVISRNPLMSADSLAGHDQKGSPEAIRFQAIRTGYFCLDKDSHEDSLVLNRIVTLKEDTMKKN